MKLCNVTIFETGDRVFVTGTRYHGFCGTVVEQFANGVMVQLDEWLEPIKFYKHQLWGVLCDS